MAGVHASQRMQVTVARLEPAQAPAPPERALPEWAAPQPAPLEWAAQPPLAPPLSELCPFSSIAAVSSAPARQRAIGDQMAGLQHFPYSLRGRCICTANEKTTSSGVLYGKRHIAKLYTSAYAHYWRSCGGSSDAGKAGTHAHFARAQVMRCPFQQLSESLWT